MTVVHLIAGYDKQTERLVIEHEIPSSVLEELRELAAVPETDPDAFGSYPLCATAARLIATMLPTLQDAETYDWFLEPAADD